MIKDPARLTALTKPCLLLWWESGFIGSRRVNFSSDTRPRGVAWERATGIENKGDAKTAFNKQKRENLEGFIRHHGLVSLEQMKAKASVFGYGKNTIETELEALAQNSVGSENPIYAFDAHINGSRYKARVYSTDPKPEGGNVETKDLDGTEVEFTV